MHCDISNNFVGASEKSQRRKRDWQIIRWYHRKRTPLLLYARSSDWKNEEGERERKSLWLRWQSPLLTFPPLPRSPVAASVPWQQESKTAAGRSWKLFLEAAIAVFLPVFSYLAEIFLPLSACAPDETAKANKKKQTLRKTRKIQIPIYKCLCFPSVRTQTSLKFFLHLNFMKIFFMTWVSDQQVSVLSFVPVLLLHQSIRARFLKPTFSTPPPFSISAIFCLSPSADRTYDRVSTVRPRGKSRICFFFPRLSLNVTLLSSL